VGLASLTVVIPVQVVWVAGVDRHPDRPSWEEPNEQLLRIFVVVGAAVDYEHPV
jgi:hypothetical protein